MLKEKKKCLRFIYFQIAFLIWISQLGGRTHTSSNFCLFRCGWTLLYVLLLMISILKCRRLPCAIRDNLQKSAQEVKTIGNLDASKMGIQIELERYMACHLTVRWEPDQWVINESWMILVLAWILIHAMIVDLQNKKLYIDNLNIFIGHISIWIVI